MRGWAGDDHVVTNGGSHDLYGKERAGSCNFSDGVVGNNGLDGGTGIHANLTNPTEGSYSRISTQGLVRIASLV
jgi:hypothetical protein